MFNNKLYYQGYSSTTGYELYSYDGTDVGLVADIKSGSDNSGWINSSYPQNFTVFDDKLFFSADDGTIGSELFYYDGSTATGIDIYTGSSTSGNPNSSWPYSFAVLNDTLYFKADDGTNGSELWGYDTASGARLIKDIAPGTYTSGSSTYPNGSSPHGLTVFNNKLYFSATDGWNVSGTAGEELWYYDGNDAGRVADIRAGSNGSSPYNLFATTDKLYFSAQDASSGTEPYILSAGDPFPSITSVTSTTSDGIYTTGDEINITVNFSEAVTLSSGGTMTVTLETGTTDQTVSITSISSATSASGTYTVQAGDLSSDLTVKSISVSGTVSDASDQAIVNFSIGSNLAASSALVVDGVLPTIASVKSSSDNATYSTGANINITVNFSEAVSISTSGTLTVTLDTGREVAITAISSTTTAEGTYTVQDNDSSSDLDVETIALSSGATLTDAAGNEMSVFTVPTDSSLADFNDIVINTSKPGTPTNLTAENRYGGIGLKWYSEASAAKYYVYRSGDNTTFEKLSTEPTDTTFIDEVTAGTKYYYYVTAVTPSSSEGDSSKHVYGYATKIWWVDINGNDSNTGKAETEAFKTIEQAVKTNSSLVSGDTIYVKPSITSTNSTKYTGYYDFGNITSGISLNHSKDFVLKSTAGADSTIFNAEGKNRHFFFDDGQTSATQIIGFTFFNGEEEGSDQSSNWEGGGSVVISGSNINIKFENCIFDSNRVTGDNNGGAIVIRDQAVPEFTNCTFKNNFVTDTKSEKSGGAVNIQSPHSDDDLRNAINFKQCKFLGNYVKVKHAGYGGAVSTMRNTIFENCLFIKNGAISGYGASANTYESSKGGAIYSAGGFGDGNGVITVVANSTFDSNYVDVRTNSGDPRAADIFYGYGSSNQSMQAYVFNTIITGSYRLLGGVDYTENQENKLFYSEDEKNRISVNYSAIEGSEDQSWADDNVFDINPVYSDATNLDYSLSNLSPVIGQGTSSFSKYPDGYPAPSIDILGASRPTSNPDMGAYENPASSSTAPLPVTSLSGTAKTNSVYLSWSAVKASLGSTSEAENIKYLIYQGDSQAGTSTSTSYTVTTLTNGTAYTFKVAAQDTTSSLTGAPSQAVSVTPAYSGPKWYVAASGGSAAGGSNADLGSRVVPLDDFTSAKTVAASGDTIVMLKGEHTGAGNRGNSFGKPLVIMGDPDYPADSTIINAGGKNNHFTFNSGEDTTYQVIGLTLYNGKTTDQGGGSVKIHNNSNPVFRNVIFKENVDESSDWRGGGAVNIGNYSTPSFIIIISSSTQPPNRTTICWCYIYCSRGRTFITFLIHS